MNLPAAQLVADPRATAIGFAAVLLWGMSALTVHLTRGLPAFEMLTICFSMGGVLLILWGRVMRGGFGFLRQSWQYYAFTIGFLFANNACYVLALRHAPPVAANLINYLWPLFIVLLSAPVLGRPLRWWHMGGALLGFGGVAWLILGGEGEGFVFDPAHAWGYVAGFGAAFSWAIYSLFAKKLYADVPTPALGPVFLGVAVCAAMTLPVGLAVPGAFNTAWRWPSGVEIPALLASGIGALMVAYACWDHGAKRGDVRVMSAGSYLTPLLSTLALAMLGNVVVSGTAWFACALIIAGAFLGSMRELLSLCETRH